MTVSYDSDHYYNFMPCPFCDGEDEGSICLAHIVTHIATSKSISEYQVVCLFCGARGPAFPVDGSKESDLEEARKRAVESWNKVCYARF